MIAVAGVLVLVAVTALLVVAKNHQQRALAGLRPSGIPPSVPSGLADLMELSPVPRIPAPGFTLTDQRGRSAALSHLRGKTVVLEFMDSRCTTICPLVSEEFIAAYHDLGPLAARVVFAAVNVNPYHAAVRDVAQFSAEYQLTTIPGWRFFTGPVPRLREVWHAYNIEVQPYGPQADSVHTSFVYFIDPQGRERYLASPMADYTKAGAAFLPGGQITAWGAGSPWLPGPWFHDCNYRRDRPRLRHQRSGMSAVLLPGQPGRRQLIRYRGRVSVEQPAARSCPHPVNWTGTGSRPKPLGERPCGT